MQFLCIVPFNYGCILYNLGYEILVENCKFYRLGYRYLAPVSLAMSAN